MKKILLGTSALVLLAGAAAAQQVTTKAPFTVTLGGSVRSDFIIVDPVDCTGQRVTDHPRRLARQRGGIQVGRKVLSESGKITENRPFKRANHVGDLAHQDKVVILRQSNPHVSSHFRHS